MTVLLRPFFTFYGAKWRAAIHYPRPEFPRLIEPFAGSAGYALRHYERDVQLYDVDPIVVGIWSYLIRTPSREIRNLPAHVHHVDDLHVCQEARWLIGFWLNRGTQCPVKTPGAWMRSKQYPQQFWGTYVRRRLALQVEYIRHWRVRELHYLRVPNHAATWFVDPPYHRSGLHYSFPLLSKQCKRPALLLAPNIFLGMEM